MILVGKSLLKSVLENNICGESLVEETCLQLRLGKYFYFQKKNNKIFKYHKTDRSDFYDNMTIEENYIDLKPLVPVIGCSNSEYKIPNELFGLVQTTGALARLFIQITTNDGQIDPGYCGAITLEIINLSHRTIRINIDEKVGNIYLIQCTTNAAEYVGQFNKGVFPSI